MKRNELGAAIFCALVLVACGCTLLTLAALGIAAAWR